MKISYNFPLQLQKQIDLCKQNISASYMRSYYSATTTREQDERMLKGITDMFGIPYHPGKNRHKISKAKKKIKKDIQSSHPEVKHKGTNTHNKITTTSVGVTGLSSTSHLGYYT